MADSHGSPSEAITATERAACLELCGDSGARGARLVPLLPDPES
jgi:hypothetical protein